MIGKVASFILFLALGFGVVPLFIKLFMLMLSWQINAFSGGAQSFFKQYSYILAAGVILFFVATTMLVFWFLRGDLADMFGNVKLTVLFFSIIALVYVILYFVLVFAFQQIGGAGALTFQPAVLGFLEAHYWQIVIGIWIFYAVGFVIASAGMVQDGFFKNL